MWQTIHICNLTEPQEYVIPYLLDEESEGQKCKITCPRPHSWQVIGEGMHPHNACIGSQRWVPLFPYILRPYEHGK